MLEKLKGLALRYEDLETRLGDPKVYGDTEKLHQINRELKELSPVVEAYRAYRAAESRRQEAEELLKGAANLEEDICYSRNLRLLTEHYKEALQTHQCEDLLRIIRAVYVKNQACAKNGRRPGQIDQRYMKRAEELLHSELSVALHIPYEEVPDYIARVIAGAEASAG